VKLAAALVLGVLVLAACEGDPMRTATPAPTVTESPLVESPSLPTRVVVPDVVGTRVTKARRVLRKARLTPFTTTKLSPERPRTVLRQRPLGGLEIRPGRTVRLVVAKPPPPPPDNDYSPPIPLGPDVDCAGGSGNGPRYEGQGDVPFGPFQVIRSDIYGLDGDGDGVGCES
jgi:hypothetical protein